MSAVLEERQSNEKKLREQKKLAEKEEGEG